MSTESFTKIIVVSNEEAIINLKNNKASKSKKMQKILSEINIPLESNIELVKTILDNY